MVLFVDRLLNLKEERKIEYVLISNWNEDEYQVIKDEDENKARKEERAGKVFESSRQFRWIGKLRSITGER